METTSGSEDSSSDRVDLETIEDLQELGRKVREQIQKLAFKDTKSAMDRIESLITYCISRVDYYEDYRTRFLAFSGTLLGFSAAFVTILYEYIGIGPMFAIGAFGLLVTCLLNVVMYLWHSIYPSYPHRPVASSQWYYMYNLPHLDRTKGDYAGKGLAKSRLWLLDLWHNAKKMSEQNDKETLLGDIEQLVILYLITAYKKRAAENMQYVLVIGLIWFAAFSLVATAILLLSK